MASIQGIYVALFGRPADPTGLDHWSTVTNGGADLSNIGDLTGTAEYQDRFTGLSNTQVINAIYQSLFGRDADPEGLAFFLAELTAGRQTINSIAINILDGAKGVDLELIDAKIAAADLFTAALDTDAEIAAYVGNDAAQVGRDFLSGVTVDNPPTIDDVNASVLTLVTNAGQEPAGPISGGGGGPVNAAPSITSDGGGDTAAVNVAENSTAVTTVAATDPEGSAVTYAVSGTDAALFTIDAGTGALSFTAAPDFENPGDANTDNVYEVTVEASDGSLKESQALSVSVTNLDAPVALNDTLKMAAPEFVVNTYTQTIQREPVIAKLANGGFVVAWESEDGQQGDTSNRAVKAGIFDASGNEVKGEFLVNEKTYSEQYQPSIAALDNGQFVIAWASTDGQQADTSGAATKARVFNADGTPATGEFIANTFYPGNQVHPAVAALGDDSFVLAWDSPPGGSIKARIFDVSDMSIETDGSVSGLGEEFLVRSASGVRSLAVTTLSSEKFIISSEPLNSDPRPVDLVDVSGMSIDAGTGAVTGVDVTEIVSNLQANGNSPSAAALANGYIVVTWTKSNSIYARVIDEAGTTKADFQVDTNTLNNQWDPSVTALSDGGFVIAWRANPNSGDYDIKARKFTIDANGALATQGTEFSVDGVTGNNAYQLEPFVTALDNGFVVAWRGNPGENIKARLFDINRTVSEDTTAVIDVAADLLANDSDPGALSFSVKTVDGTSAKGAALTFDAGAGTITYDPTGAATLQALNTNQNTTDTFTYTIENTNGETAQAVVTISVLGLNEVY